MRRTILAALLAVVSIMASCQNDPYVVKTTNGRVRGFDEEGTMAFKGIPYVNRHCFKKLDEFRATGSLK